MFRSCKGGGACPVSAAMSASSAATHAEPTAPVTVRAHPRRVIFILGAVTAFSSVAIDMYLPAFPSIAQDLRTSMGSVELTVSLFLAGMGVGQAFYGPLSDRWGRRAPLLVGGLLYAVAAIGCALAHSIHLLVAGRLLMALGGSAGGVIARAMVRDWFDAHQSAHVFSSLMLVMGVAPILAPLLGGQILLLTGWRGLFVLFAVFGVACTVAVAAGLPESLPPARRLTGGLGEVFRGYGRLLVDPRFSAFILAAGFASGLLFTYITGAAAVLMGVYGVIPQKFGLFFGANGIGFIAGSQVNRRLLGRFSPAQILRGAFHVTATTALLILVHGLTNWGGLAVLAVLLWVLLTSLGFIYPNISALTMAPFTTQAGSASALLGTAQYVIGCTVGGLVSLFHNGTALPMAAMIAVNAVVGWLLVQRALRRA